MPCKWQQYSTFFSYASRQIYFSDFSFHCLFCFQFPENIVVTYLLPEEYFLRLTRVHMLPQVSSFVKKLSSIHRCRGVILYSNSAKFSLFLTNILLYLNAWIFWKHFLWAQCTFGFCCHIFNLLWHFQDLCIWNGILTSYLGLFFTS